MENRRIDVAAWPTECVRPDVVDKRFPVWLHRDAGVVKANVDWS